MICRIVLALLLSAWPVRVARSPEPQMAILKSEDREGHVCALVEYTVPGGERVQAYLLVPHGALPKSPRPGLVLLHDHGARFDIGKEKLVRPLSSEPENLRLSSAQWMEDNFDGVPLAERLAAKGYVVLVPDMLYWGSRSTPSCRKWSRVRFLGEEGDLKALKAEVYEGQRAVYDSLARRGEIWAEKTLWEDAAAARLLARLPYVDKKKIGAFGWSMGAHRCWLLTAFCRQVRAGFALCWMTLKSGEADPPTASDHSMMIPALRERHDFPDIASRLRPKPFFFLAGRQDKLFPAPLVEEAYARMRTLYGKDGEALRTEFFDGPHHCGLDVQQQIEDWFLEVLPIN